jgi:hypothetical protein
VSVITLRCAVGRAGTSRCWRGKLDEGSWMPPDALIRYAGVAASCGTSLPDVSRWCERYDTVSGGVHGTLD